MSSKEIYFPRIVIAGVSSGVGKTTVSLAVMAALTKRGFDVKPFKIGPDFIDTGYHEMVTGKISRNLDTFLVPKKRVLELFAFQHSPGSIAVVEGVMGLYDGRAVNDGIASTAEVAKSLRAPVILVIDGSKMGQSAAALALGYRRYDKNVNLAGVIVNNVNSVRHLNVISGSLQKVGLKTIGYLTRDENIKLPERHLGLMSHLERPDAKQTISEIAQLAVKTIDIDSIIDIAKSSVSLKSNFIVSDIKESQHKKVNIAVARDEAFYFYYQDGLEELERNGANLISFSPLRDTELPRNSDGLIVGGGFPEMFAAELSTNKSMKSSIKEFAESNRPVYGECGGLIYLGKSHTDFRGSSFEMADVLSVKTKMQPKKRSIGYVEAELCRESIIGKKGTVYNGHEFHWSSATPLSGLNSAYIIAKANDEKHEGFNHNNIFASYVHLHFSGSDNAALSFINSCKE